MDCDHTREAISAVIDREATVDEARAVEEHLARCGTCRRWREEAHSLTRQLRLAPVRHVPAPDPSLLPAVAAARWERRRGVPGGALRAGLLVVAALQLALTVPALVLGADHDAPIHVAHEMGAFDLALAAGFLVAAWRPRRADGMSPIVGVAALVLLVTAVVDLAAGRTELSDEAPHLLALVGWLLLRGVARGAPERGGEGALRERLRRLRTPRPEELAPASDGARDDRTAAA